MPCKIMHHTLTVAFFDKLWDLINCYHMNSRCQESPLLLFFIVFNLSCRHPCGDCLNSLLCLYIKIREIWASSWEGFWHYFVCSLVAGLFGTGWLLTAASSLLHSSWTEFGWRSKCHMVPFYAWLTTSIPSCVFVMN